jgi:hypothetical protein
MSSTFESIYFKHSLREANRVANDLAKFSFLNNGFVIGSMNPLTLF